MQVLPVCATPSLRRSLMEHDFLAQLDGAMKTVAWNFGDGGYLNHQVGIYGSFRNWQPS